MVRPFRLAYLLVRVNDGRPMNECIVIYVVVCCNGKVRYSFYVSSFARSAVRPIATLVVVAVAVVANLVATHCSYAGAR